MKKNERIDLLLEVLADQRRIGTLHHAAAERAEKRALSAETDLAIEKARASAAEKERDGIKNLVCAPRSAQAAHALVVELEQRIAVLESTADQLRADVLAMEEQRDAAVKELAHVKGIVLAPAPAWDNSKAAEAAQVRIAELEGQMRRAVELALEVGADPDAIEREEIASVVATFGETAYSIDEDTRKTLADAILAHIGKPAPAPPALFKVGDRVRAMGGRIIGTVASYQFGFFTIRDGDGTAWYCPAAAMTLLSPQMDNQ